MADPKFPTLEERWAEEAKDGPILQIEEDPFLEEDMNDIEDDEED